MALPAGITTATVTFGDAVDFAGQPVATSVTFRPSVSLLWAATGQPVIAFPETVTAAGGGPGSIVLPHTDQAGFVDGYGTPIVNWSYVATGEWSAGGAKEPFRREFQIPTGTTTLDLDTVPGAVGTTSPPSMIGPPGPPGPVGPTSTVPGPQGIQGIPGPMGASIVVGASPTPTDTKIWVGNQSEYDAIAVKDPATLYHVYAEGV